MIIIISEFLFVTLVPADAAQADKQLAYTLLLAENICQKHGVTVSSAHQYLTNNVYNAISEPACLHQSIY